MSEVTYNISIAYDFGVSIKHVVLPRHGPLAHYTNLEAPSIAKMNSIFQGTTLEGFQGPLDFHGHGS
jgi:hypothetical protein